MHLMDSSSPVMSLLCKGEGLTATYSSDDAIQRHREIAITHSSPTEQPGHTKVTEQETTFRLLSKVCVCVRVCLSVSLCLYAASNVHSANTLCTVEWMPTSCSVHVLGVSRLLCVFNGPHQSFHCVLEITHSCGLIGLWWDTFVLAVVWCVRTIQLVAAGVFLYGSLDCI